MNTNTINKESTGKKPAKSGAKFIVNLLDGSFLINEWTKKQLPFIFYIVLLAAVYITNVVSAEKKHRKIINLEKEIVTLVAQLSIINSKLDDNKRYTVIADKLKSRDIKKNVESYTILKDER